MKLTWFDSVNVDLTATDAGKNFAMDALDVQDSSGKPFLEVKVRATHSGQLITGRCYTGWGMKNGCSSWYDMANGGSAAFDKPIIVNHDLSSKPLGRVVYAEYTQLKDGDDWTNDWRNPDTGAGNFGSGYITTTGHIFDSEAIEMILDGRYKTVSTRQTASEAWCSVCGKSLRMGCDHEPGKWYPVDTDDGEEVTVPCFIICGDLSYVEESMVNSPRQPNAKVTQMKMIKKALLEAGADAQYFAGDALYEDSAPLEVFMRSNDGSKIVNLADSELPSLGTITGRTQVAMSKKIVAAAPNLELEGLSDKQNEENLESQDTEETTDQEDFDFAFANLARYWKDSLDLKTEHKDSHFLVGITDKAAGHAHVFDAYVDDERIMKGSTYTTGQGKAKYRHVHSIWVEGVDLNAMDVTGETRGASAGDEHMHSFKASMSDGENTYVTLIAGINEIQESIQTLDERVNKDTLALSDSDVLLDGDDAEINWDDNYKAAALRLVGRLSPSKRQEVLNKMFDNDLSDQNEVQDNDMDKSTVERLLADLLADKEKLTAKVAELTQLSDSKEAERQRLLDENVKLKSGVLSLKASIVAGAQSRLADEEFSEKVLETKIEELSSKDEAELDAMIDSEVLGNIRKEVVVPEKTEEEVDSSDEDSEEEDLTDGAPISPVSDSVKTDEREHVEPKSFASLASRVK